MQIMGLITYVSRIQCETMLDDNTRAGMLLRLSLEHNVYQNPCPYRLLLVHDIFHMPFYNSELHSGQT